jgi:hypothetical protein
VLKRARTTEFRAERLPAAAPMIVAPDREALDCPFSTKMVWRLISGCGA